MGEKPPFLRNLHRVPLVRSSSHMSMMIPIFSTEVAYPPSRSSMGYCWWRWVSDYQNTSIADVPNLVSPSHLVYWWREHKDWMVRISIYSFWLIYPHQHTFTTYSHTHTHTYIYIYIGEWISIYQHTFWLIYSHPSFETAREVFPGEPFRWGWSLSESCTLVFSVAVALKRYLG